MLVPLLANYAHFDGLVHLSRGNNDAAPCARHILAQVVLQQVRWSFDLHGGWAGSADGRVGAEGM